MTISNKMRRALQRIAEGSTLCGHSEPTLRALMVRGLIEFEPATELTSYRPAFNLTPVRLTNAGIAMLRTAQTAKCLGYPLCDSEPNHESFCPVITENR